MPLLKRRYNWAKVYRPNGTRYSEARHPSLQTAISSAMLAFEREFGRLPHQSMTFVEVMGVTGDWIVNVFEVEE